jgi:hypothetical protein
LCAIIGNAANRRERFAPVSFDLGSLVASFFVSAVGFVLFSFGRRMQRTPQIVAGVTLLIAPYFVPGVLFTLLLLPLVAVLLWAALWYGL